MSTLPLIAVGEAWLHTHGYSEGYNFIIGVSPFKKAATACFSGLTVWPNQEIFGVLSRQVEHGHGSSTLRFPVCYHKIYLAPRESKKHEKKGPEERDRKSSKDYRGNKHRPVILKCFQPNRRRK
jgi:hypothetical protein